MKIDSQLIGSIFGVCGAFLISFSNPIAFFFFLVTNVSFIVMGFQKGLKPFLVLQFAFLMSTLIGIFNNFDFEWVHSII
jgi:nicotinamide riboside transporter PnuC